MNSVHQDAEVGNPQVNINQAAELQRHWRQAIGILGKRGGRFVSLARRSKGSGLPKGWNQDANLLTAQQALAALDAGRNVGLASGTGNLYILDFDRDAERGHECEQLAGGFYTYRTNATHKAKFIFTCPDPLPTRLKNKTAGLDLLGINANGTHWQGVIAGIHDSGAPIRWGGHTVPELPAETVAALWQEWTGADLFAAEREPSEIDPTYADADLGRVADALRHVDPNAIDYMQWQGVIAALHDAFGDAALDLAIDWADGQPGEVEAKWRTYDRDYTGKAATLATVFYLARKAGWEDTWLQDRLRDYRRWLASPDAIADLKAAGFKNPERARKLLDAILQRCEQDRRLRITPGHAYLAKTSGISQAGLGAYLARLFAANLIDLAMGQEATREKPASPTVITLVFHNLIAPPIGSCMGVEGSDQVVKNWNCYREFRADELFFNGHAVYNATHPRATLPPLGDNGLGVLLALLDGPATTSEAAGLLGYSCQAARRILQRYADHDLVTVTAGERNRKTYALKEEWRAILQANRPKTTTYGVSLFRHDKALERRIKHLHAYGDYKRIAELQAERERLQPLLAHVIAEAGIVSYVAPERTDKRRRRLTRLVVAGERAEHRPPVQKQTEADRWRRKEYAKTRAEVEAHWPEFSAWAEATHGPGWWTRLDQTAVIGQYKVWQVAGDVVPTVRWAGAEVAA